VESLLEILDRLERVLRRQMDRLPGEHRRAIEREVLGLVQMARAAAPRELHHAAGLQGEAEAALARAREEARRLVLDAQAHARSLTDTGPGAPAARRLLDTDEARREADRIRRGADEYAAQVLNRLTVEVERVLTTIRRGQDMLRAPDSPGAAPADRARRVR